MRGIAYLLVWLTHLWQCLAEVPNNEPADHYHKFVTRPDIEPARWKVTIHDEASVAPGYWFVSPYEKNGYKQEGLSWIGPHIYDGNGELIWSGSHMFNRINVMDFKVQNVEGTDMLSMLYAVEGNAYILDDQYKVKQTVFTGQTGVTFNMHDFHTIENGTRYLYLQRNLTGASVEMSREELGFDGQCKVAFPGFEERDVASKEKLFKWDGTGNIPFSDSTMQFAPVNQRCASYWDYLHSNAIDKFVDGNYLISTRHSDTIYKISKDDGSIIWRLHGHGGERSDFEMGNLNFSRQHHARIHEQNDTHTIITFLDNAVGADQQPATSDCTRALTVSLREDLNPMTAEIIARYDHPHGQHAFRRGSYQILPNGNAFIGWSEQAFQSEHTADGTLVMEAELAARKLGTYRAFKFPWTSKPDYPPDVHSETFGSVDGAVTQVHASWNGATEVNEWVLYRTDKEGKRSMKLMSRRRSGFETKLTYDNFAKYICVEGVDKNGESLGKSQVFETLGTTDVSDDLVAAEDAWLSEGDDSETGASWFGSILNGQNTTFGFGILCGAIAFFGLLLARRRGWSLRRKARSRGLNYQRVAEEDAWEFDESRLDDLPSRTRAAHLPGLARPEDFEDSDSDDRHGHQRTPSSGQSSNG